MFQFMWPMYILLSILISRSETRPFGPYRTHTHEIACPLACPPRASDPLTTRSYLVPLLCRTFPERARFDIPTLFRFPV